MYSRIHREEVAKCISHLENLGHGFKPDKTEPLRRVPEGYELVVDTYTSDESGGLHVGLLLCPPRHALDLLGRREGSSS